MTYAVVNLHAHIEKFFKFRSQFIEHYDNAGNHYLYFIRRRTIKIWVS